MINKTESSEDGCRMLRDASLGFSFRILFFNHFPSLFSASLLSAQTVASQIEPAKTPLFFFFSLFFLSE